MINIKDYTQIGKTNRTHGVKGNIICESIINLHNIDKPEFLFFKIDNYLVPFYIETFTVSSNKTMIVKFEDIDDIDKATEYRDVDLYLKTDSILDNDNFEDSYDILIGYTVICSETENIIGVITHIATYSHNIVMTIINKDKKEILIPLNNEIITDIIEEEKQLIIEIPEGLLEIYS